VLSTTMTDMGRVVKGELFAIELPAGKYEIYCWSVASGVSEINSPYLFSIEFSVAPGTTTYIGSFHFVTRRLGLAAIRSAEVDYADRAERDVPLIEQRFAGRLPGKEIDRSPPMGKTRQRLGTQKTGQDIPQKWCPDET